MASKRAVGEPLEVRSGAKRAAQTAADRWLDEGRPGRLADAPAAASTVELVRLQRSAGNRAVARALVQRQTAPSPASVMTRDQFVETLSRRYGVGRARAGTFAEQQGINSRPDVAPTGRLTEATWRSWDPGASSDIYRSILEAFANFESTLGGIPPVSEVLFFDTAFVVSPSTHAVVPEAGIGADFGAGHLNVYRSGVDGTMSTRKGIPVGRSQSSGNYPPVGASMQGRGTNPGAPIPLPTAAENTGRIITHELGHGLAEQAMAADPAMFAQYRQAIGWVGDQLFDVGIPEVRQALAAGNPPPTTVQVRRNGTQVAQPTEITRDNWNNPQWVEQPVSGYSVAGGASEDFPEAVMAYINSRDVLAARSPLRLQFLESRRASWLPHLRVNPPVGDFPAPKGPERVA